MHRGKRAGRRGLIRLLAGAMALCCLTLPRFALAEDGVLTLPDGIQEIQEEAFSGLTGVRAVELSDGIETIGDGAFSAMPALSRITIPETVVSIGSNILEGCKDAALVMCAPGSAAMRYAVANRLDYEADTTCRALLIAQVYEGNTYYKPLPGADFDAESFAKCLKAFTGRRFQTTICTELTTDGINDAILSTFADAREQDISLFYYAGHGSVGGNLVGTDNKYYSPAMLRQALDAVPGRKIIIIDACYSGALITEDEAGTEAAATNMVGRSASNADALSDFDSDFIAAFRRWLPRSVFNPSSYFVLTAASDTQESWGNVAILPDGEVGYVGVFTNILCKGCGWDELGERTIALAADADHDAAVSIEELYQYIKAEVTWPDEVYRQDVQVYPSNCAWFAPFRN